ncbi:MAG: hypothetical protein II656_03815 [Ruminococcus sp.]|nr:hypothetical protein [Ruminococcus sp.]
MSQKERLEYLTSKINRNSGLKDAIFDICDGMYFYPPEDLMEDLGWLLEGGCKEEYDLLPFTDDGCGGLYVLVNDEHVAYIDSEGSAGYIAENIDDFFSILLTFRYFCTSPEIFESYEKFLEEYNSDLLADEIESDPKVDKFIKEENLETDKKKLYEKLVKGLTILPKFSITATEDDYVDYENILGIEEDEFEELCKKYHG